MSLWPQAVAASRRDMVRDGVFPKSAFVLMNRGPKGTKWYKAAKTKYAQMKRK